jgi:hypothetical protein
VKDRPDKEAGPAPGPATDNNFTLSQTVPAAVEIPHGRAGRRRSWSSHEVATLVELAFSLAWHQYRTGSLDGLEREVAPLNVRVDRLARSLDRTGAVRRAA